MFLKTLFIIIINKLLAQIKAIKEILYGFGVDQKTGSSQNRHLQKRRATQLVKNNNVNDFC